MNAMLSRHEPAAARSSGLHCYAIALTTLIALSATASELAPTPVPEAEPLTAVWKWREVDFFYRSRIAAYSCDALKARVTSILRAVGGRDDMQVRVDNCEQMFTQQEPLPGTWNTPSSQTSAYLDRRNYNSNNREQLAHVRARVLMPVEMTPDVVKEMERDKSRRELISRVTRNPAAGQDDPVVFYAQRHTVTLSRKTIGLDPVECELVDQIAPALRRLDVRVVRRNFSCSKDTVSKIAPQLTVEALMAVAPGASELPEIEDESAADPAEGSTGEAQAPPTPAESPPSGLAPVTPL